MVKRVITNAYLIEDDDGFWLSIGSQGKIALILLDTASPIVQKTLLDWAESLQKEEKMSDSYEEITTKIVETCIDNDKKMTISTNLLRISMSKDSIMVHFWDLPDVHNYRVFCKVTKPSYIAEGISFILRNEVTNKDYYKKEIAEINSSALQQKLFSLGMIEICAKEKEEK